MKLNSLPYNHTDNLPPLTFKCLILKNDAFGLTILLDAHVPHILILKNEVKFSSVKIPSQTEILLLKYPTLSLTLL